MACISVLLTPYKTAFAAIAREFNYYHVMHSKALQAYCDLQLKWRASQWLTDI